MGKSEKKDKNRKEAKEAAPEAEDVVMEDVNVIFLSVLKPILKKRICLGFAQKI
jgi:hypothetical protein